MRRRRRVLASVLAACLAVWGAACGGGGGSSPTEPPPTPPPSQGLSFTAASSAGPTSLALERTNNGNQVLELALRARGISGVYGLYFDLDYPAAFLEFEGADEGDLLSAGGTPTAFQVAEQNGRLVVAVSRLGQVGGAGGTGTVLTLRFRATGNGSGALSFSRNAAETQDSRVLSADWIGGTATANL